MNTNKRLYTLSSTILFVSNEVNQDTLLEEAMDYLNDQISSIHDDPVIEVISLDDLPGHKPDVLNHSVYGAEDGEPDSVQGWLELATTRIINGKKYKLVPIDE